MDVLMVYFGENRSLYAFNDFERRFSSALTSIGITSPWCSNKKSTSVRESLEFQKNGLLLPEALSSCCTYCSAKAPLNSLKTESPSNKTRSGKCDWAASKPTSNAYNLNSEPLSLLYEIRTLPYASPYETLALYFQSARIPPYWGHTRQKNFISQTFTTLSAQSISRSTCTPFP